MNVDQRIRHEIGDLIVRLHIALAEIEELKAKQLLEKPAKPIKA